MKNSDDTIGNRSRDLLPCSVMPQPTAPPRAPLATLINPVYVWSWFFEKPSSTIITPNNCSRQTANTKIFNGHFQLYVLW
jgi:hypothetical protein